jgi:hypothetical protein
MATAESSSLQGRNVYVSDCGLISASTTEAVTGMLGAYRTPNATGTTVLSTVVPADGAQLVAMSFTVHSAGTVTTSGTQQFAVSDGTNDLATLAATSVVQSAGAVLTFTMGTATNGKNLATTAGSRLILTNTEAGTIADGMHGIFRLVWAL